MNYAVRPTSLLDSVVCSEQTSSQITGQAVIHTEPAQIINNFCDYWITDPGYADAVNYEEVSEFFLAAYGQRLQVLFPEWYDDSKRHLAVKGTGEQFRVTLSDCYKRMAQFMSNDGYQVVMFTHQDPSVWADVALVLWSAGLQVITAWTIQTETPSTGVKGGAGNYVQGTVCLVLRKRQEERYGDLADLYPDIQAEVERQLASMLALDPKDDRNFGDADYQLAAYAAALRVLTGYSSIGEIDVERELRRTRARNERSPLAKLIEQAVRIASDVLTPEGFDPTTWRSLAPEERLYLKGIEVEARGEGREGVYQELARGYGATDYREMLGSRIANSARLKTPSEFGTRDLRAASGFGSTLLRQVLYAIHATASHAERDPKDARDYLKRNLPDYWHSRQTIIDLLRYLNSTPHGLAHWSNDLYATRLLLGSIEADTA